MEPEIGREGMDGSGEFWTDLIGESDSRSEIQAQPWIHGGQHLESPWGRWRSRRGESSMLLTYTSHVFAWELRFCSDGFIAFFL
jgi:hypothetical protein